MQITLTYTKCTGTQAEDKHVINQLTFFSALTHSGIPRIHFILSFSHSSAFFLPFSSSSISTGLHFSFSIQDFVVYNGKADGQTAGTEALPAQGNLLGLPRSAGSDSLSKTF